MEADRVREYFELMGVPEPEEILSESYAGRILRSEKQRQQIHRIVLYEWGPIGLGADTPLDEYSDAELVIHQLLSMGVSCDFIEEYLAFYTFGWCHLPSEVKYDRNAYFGRPKDDPIRVKIRKCAENLHALA